MTYCVACRWANRPHHTRRDHSSALSYHIKLKRWTTYQQQNPHVLPVFLSHRILAFPFFLITCMLKIYLSSFFLFFIRLWGIKKNAPIPRRIPASCNKNNGSMNKKRENSLTLKRQVIAVQCFHVKPWVTLKCKGPLRGQRVGDGGWWASVHGAVARTCSASRLQGRKAPAREAGDVLRVPSTTLPPAGCRSLPQRYQTSDLMSVPQIGL